MLIEANQIVVKKKKPKWKPKRTNNCVLFNCWSFIDNEIDQNANVESTFFRYAHHVPVR